MTTTDQKLDALNLRLDVVLAKLEAYNASAGAGLDTLRKLILGDIQATSAAQVTTLKDQLLTGIKTELAASVAVAKEKKKTATTPAAGGTETKTAEKKDSAPKAAGHPTLINISAAAWKNDGKKTPYENTAPWFTAMLTYYPTRIYDVIGPELTAKIPASDEYKAKLDPMKKKGDREKAKAFLEALKLVVTKQENGTTAFAALSDKLMTLYTTELAQLNAVGISQVTTEPKSAAEAAAESALSAAGLGASDAKQSSAGTSSSTSSVTDQLAAVTVHAAAGAPTDGQA